MISFFSNFLKQVKENKMLKTHLKKISNLNNIFSNTSSSPCKRRDFFFPLSKSYVHIYIQTRTLAAPVNKQVTRVYKSHVKIKQKKALLRVLNLRHAVFPHQSCSYRTEQTTKTNTTKTDPRPMSTRWTS